VRKPDQAQAHGNANSVILAGGISAIFTMCLLKMRMAPINVKNFDVKKNSSVTRQRALISLIQPLRLRA